jgi:uncharacterized protein
MIRQALEGDFGRILELNEGSVHHTSPLDQEGLSLLHDQAAYHKVFEWDGRVAAFLLAFREGAGYGSPNYLWFADRYGRFLYIDRIVVHEDHRGKGFGAALYDDIISWACTQGIGALACEFDISPSNPASARFHERYGFREVGTQWLNGGKKQVSLRVKEIPAMAGNVISTAGGEQ